MEAFLKQVADHYIKEANFSDLEFIFPNRRSSVFFRKYVCSAAARLGKAVIMPECTTINDLFSGLNFQAVGGEEIALPPVLEFYTYNFNQ